MLSMRKIDNYEKSQAVHNRESWLKVFVIVLFSSLISWKIVTTPINISGFDFSDLLSLILAMFAITLSLVFYIKTIETSNDFYDNTYKFTNNVSEILGRIESGFGERLRHLDEGYSGLRDKFDKMPVDIYKVEKQVQQEEEEVKKKEEERNKIIESLAEKAKLQENEKKDLFLKLHEIENELNDAKSDVLFLQKKLASAEISGEKHFNGTKMMSYIRRKLISKMGGEINLESDKESIKRRFNSSKDELSPGFLKDMKRSGLVDSEFNLNDDGVDIIISLS